MKRRDALVKELETGGRLSARELASRLGVSKSTAVRDVAKLREAGVRIRLDRGGSAITGYEAAKRAVDRTLLGRRVLRVEYLTSKGVATAREVEPSVCLGGRGGHWYLVAWCRLREDVRVFRLDRITSAEVTDERFLEPGRARLAELTEAVGG
jgi:predicted DNA-binding transcriptional regulator YafY